MLLGELSFRTDAEARVQKGGRRGVPKANEIMSCFFSGLSPVPPPTPSFFWAPPSRNRLFLASATLVRLGSCLPKGRKQSSICLPRHSVKGLFCHGCRGSVDRWRDSGRLRNRQKPLSNITPLTPSPGLLILGSGKPVPCSWLPCCG